MLERRVLTLEKEMAEKDARAKAWLDIRTIILGLVVLLSPWILEIFKTLHWLR